MDIKKILSYVDHTLLAQGATWNEIKAILDDGIKYGCASCCIPASYVKQAKEYVGDKLAICTVIGFPNGYSTTATKCFETQDAITNGADEIDMVINVGALKDKDYDTVRNDIKAVRDVCEKGKITLKVIIETCLLNDEEKKLACELALEAEADFVKTSTGFSTGGATTDDVALMRATVGDKAYVKASGGIRDKATAAAMVEAGADRLGTSATVAIVG